MTTVERRWSAQQEAIFAWFECLEDASSNPHLVGEARAGTGKTTVIVEGVKRAPERSTLIAAFSKTIQLELEARFTDALTKVRSYPWIKAQTLHSVGFACVRLFRDRITVAFNNDRADALALSVCGRNAPDAVVRLVSKLHTKGREIVPHAKNMGDLTEIAITFECEPEESWTAAGFGLPYVEQKALEAMELASACPSGTVIDGSDMIFLPVRNGWLRGLYDLVVIDEAQDMTVAQLEIAQGVTKKGGRIAVIGDNRQAIFAFRGADSESLNRLHGELNAVKLGLKTTYRCGKKIVARAQTLVPDIEAGPDNPDGEVLELNTSLLVGDAGPGNFILSRVNAPLVSIAMQLLRKGKRTRILGKDIGKGLIALIRKLRATSVPDFLRRVEMWASKETKRLESQMSAAATPGRKAAVQSKMEAIADQADMLISLAEGKKNITEITNQIEELFSQDDLGVAGLITCSSVHKAKGLEADKVYILQDTIRNWNIEEQNIEYVAITRAKNTLVIVSNSFEVMN